MFRDLVDEVKKNVGFTGKMVILTYRFGNHVYYTYKIPLVKQFLWGLYKLMDFIFLKVIAGAEIPAQTKIGKGLFLAHSGLGVVIHPSAQIGRNVVIYHQVTIGINPGELNKSTDAPIIGDNVYIYTGAKVIGNVSIGYDVKVGANSVVVNSVPDRCNTVGIPNRIYHK